MDPEVPPRLITIAPDDPPDADNHLHADESAATVAAVLGQHGVEWQQWPADHAHLQTKLQELQTTTDAPLIFYWIGHGRMETSKDYRLAVNGSALRDRWYDADQLVEAVRNRLVRAAASGYPQRWALMIMDTCASTRGTFGVMKALPDDIRPPKNLALLGTTEADYGVSFSGRLPAVLEETLRSFTRNDTDGIPLREVVNQLRTRLELDYISFDSLRADALLPHRLDAVGGTMPNDVYQELSRVVGQLPPDQRDHFIVKAQGAELGELAWYFSGRETERAAIKEWLERGPDGLLVVTGEPGAGKSALLGMVLAGTHPDLVRVIASTGFSLGTSEINPDVRFDLVLHLRGLTLADCFDRLATTLEAADLDDSTWKGVHDAEAVVVLLRQGDRPLLIMLDALDEARDPLTIASGFVRRLAALPGIKIILGCRATLQHRVDQYDPDAPTELLDALAAETVIFLQRDPDAASRYLELKLSSVEPPFSPLVPAAIEQIAHAAQPFLFVRLISHELVANPLLLLPEFAEQLAVLLSGGHAAIFRLAVERITLTHPAGAALLEALAQAQGHGYPRHDGVWAAAARPLSPVPISESHIDAILTIAGPYIMVDGEHDQTTYRLAHQTFVQTYLDVPGPAPNAIFEALFALAAQTTPQLNPYLRFYLPRHARSASNWEQIADHPEIIDALDPQALAVELTRTVFGQPEFSLRLQVALVATPQLVQARDARDRSLARTLSRRRLGGSPSAQEDDPRVGWTQLIAVVPHIPLTESESWVQDVAFGLIGTKVVLASADMHALYLWDPVDGSPLREPIATPMTDGIRAMAMTATAEFPPLVATAHSSGRISLWNPLSGDLVATLQHQAAVNALALGNDRGGTTLIMSGGEDQCIKIWRADRPDTPPRVLRHDANVKDLAAVQWIQHLILLSGADDRTVRGWDPLSGAELFRLPVEDIFVDAVAGLVLDDTLLVAVGHTTGLQLWRVGVGSRGAFVSELVFDVETDNWVRSVALTTLDDSVLLAVGGDDYAVWLWNPQTAAPIGRPATGANGTTTSVAFAHLPGGQTRLASGSRDNFVRLWDPRLTIPDRPFVVPLYEGRVITTQVGGKRVVVATEPSSEHSLSVRDLASGREVRPRLTAHRSYVTGLAAVTSADQDQTWVASSGWDNIVRLWDIETGSAVSTWPTAKATIRCLAAGRLRGGSLIIAVGGTEVVQLWYPEVAGHNSTTVPLERGQVNGVALFRSNEGQDLLAYSVSDSRKSSPDLQAVNVVAVDRPQVPVTTIVVPDVAVDRLSSVRLDGWPAILALCYNVVRFFDPAAGGEVRPALVSAGRVEAALLAPFSGVPDQVITAQEEGTITISRLDGGQWREHGVLDVAPSQPLDLALDGTRLMVMAHDGLITLDLPELAIA